MSFPIATYEQALGEVLPYSNDWSRWLGQDTIAGSTWISVAGVLVTSSPSFNATTTSVRIAANAASIGSSYLVTNRITTLAGSTAERTIQINVALR